jgi:serine/threonine protein kinase
MRIVHRDVKPSNLLLSIDGVVKVVDFGIATGQFSGREAAAAAFVRGSPGFTAPERSNGAPDTPAVDVYGLGASLFMLLTGHLLVLSVQPEKHDAGLARALEHLPEAGLPPFHLARTRRLIRRMCAHECTRRPRMAEVGQALAAILADARLAPDLPQFATRYAKPLHANRVRRPPHEDPRWADVQFLEATPVAGEPRAALPAPPGDPRTADSAFRAFLTTPGWHNDKRALDDLLAAHPAWTGRPALELIARRDLPWWNVWTRRPEELELVAALNLLFDRPTDGVRDVARSLAQHEDEQVARAARSLIAWGAAGDAVGG